MKKLALVSAIAAATMTSMSAHANINFFTGGISIGGTPYGVPCAIGSTYSGGPDGVMTNDGAGGTGTTSLAGTICMDPTLSGAPYVMIRALMADAGTPLTMAQGSIQVLTNWSATSGWTPYSIVAVTPTNPITCTQLSTTGPACSATLFGYSAVLTL